VTLSSIYAPREAGSIGPLTARGRMGVTARGRITRSHCSQRQTLYDIAARGRVSTLPKAGSMRVTAGAGSMRITAQGTIRYIHRPKQDRYLQGRINKITARGRIKGSHSPRQARYEPLHEAGMRSVTARGSRYTSLPEAESIQPRPEAGMIHVTVRGSISSSHCARQD
jgi:hypothetical protein